MPQATATAIAPVRARTPSTFINAVACVLGDAAKAIRKFGVAAHNRCPWVVYINKLGRVCSHFIARAKFSGYDFQFGNGAAVVTNLETGKRYTVLLTSLYCSCEAFKYSPFPKQPCKHIRMVAELRGELEQVIAQHELEQHPEEQAASVAPEHVGIDKSNLPKGCFLEDKGDVLLEYFVNVHVMSRVKGILTPTTKCVGRLIEGMNSIQAYRLRSGIYRSFRTTCDAVTYLVNSSDYRLADVAAAYENYLDERF